MIPAGAAKAVALRRPLWRRLRRDYAATPAAFLVTLGCGGILLLIGWTLADWAILRATFDPEPGREACRAAGGACWPVIAARWRVILFGLYPYDEQWRPALACLVVAFVILLSCLPRMWGLGRLAVVWVAGALLFYLLMRGGVLGLTPVNEQQWGGLPRRCSSSWRPQ